jgi:hypothetical protein
MTRHLSGHQPYFAAENNRSNTDSVILGGAANSHPMRRREQPPDAARRRATEQRSIEEHGSQLLVPRTFPDAFGKQRREIAVAVVQQECAQHTRRIQGQR